MTTTAPEASLSDFTRFLASRALLDEQQAQMLRQQAADDNVSLIALLIKKNLLAGEQFAQHLAEYYGLPLLDLDAFDASYVSTPLFNHPLFQKYTALPLYEQNGQLYLAVADPTLPIVNEIGFHTGLNTHLILVAADKLDKTLTHLQRQQLNAGFQDIDVSDLDLEHIEISSEESIDMAQTAEEVDNAPVVRFINKILLDAINLGASDIHFEPYDHHYRIRFRQDGLLREVAAPPLKLANYLTTRLKIMANLDISDRRIPQDGRFNLNLAKNRSIDFRVNTCPTLYGEKVVLRILDSSLELLDIDKLGMDDQQQTIFSEMIQHSQGMILVTGPTGSGKTVTQYTGLRMINTMDKNTSTVEDPIEIHLDGINQVQVNLKTGMTFATALRAFLRQDPDIIMVGEIRDLETAEIAVKASQTGHLVLSTLHTNSAAETLVRLANMGVAPYNIASSIILIIAQRLVRKLCEHCKKPIDIPAAALLKAGFAETELPKLKLYQPSSCQRCQDGYKGRVGIYEVMPISKAMERLIMENRGALELAEQAEREKVLSMRQSGLNKVRAGVTSLTELSRVVSL